MTNLLVDEAAQVVDDIVDLFLSKNATMAFDFF